MTDQPQVSERRWDAENTHRVFDWLWSSGQLSAQDIVALPQIGVRCVINLALPSASNALPGEADLITSQGITYIHMPVVWDAPQQAELDRFCALLQLFEGQPTWVHCAKNMRVSSFLYLYRRLWRGEDEAHAASTLNAVWTPNATWRTFIDEAIALRA